MFKVVDSLIKRYLSNEEVVIFILLLLAGLGVLAFWGGILAPVLIAIVLAFLMQGVVNKLKGFGLGHTVAVSIVFLVFMAAFGLFIGFMIPIAWRQAVKLVNDLPRMVGELQDLVDMFALQNIDYISQSALNEVINTITAEVANLGQWLVSFSLSSIPSLFSLLIYLVLVPIVMFFLMKDQDRIIAYLTSWLPKERRMMNMIAHEMNDQIANYIRGKFIEMVVVGIVSYIVFLYFDLRYAELMGLLVGLSVLIPYIGAAAVTVPVALVAFYQFGATNEFLYVFGAYLVVQALDGNVLVPVLFSEAVNLHPVAIIVAVLIFGGLWGFWGVFFAIPLATLVKAIINAWPKGHDYEADQS
ncbi:AI-2E family transporter [Maribrevibacterium harenarium]|uniref:AI-2E family transporter n=1 Tax=Maribrevibacterium harenarium TaxID=2589817 RepID=A0A501X4N5_9GAMM|nr:AI-2E family transporter [Maribrevibacterium harenarium]TPE55482.1 AI-2E family transporter [Maribrevibacterium harenarium]